MNTLIARNGYKVASKLCLSSRPVAETRGVVVHALHKSASTFLFKFFQRLARRQGFHFYSENLPGEAQAAPPSDVEENFCWGPVRHLRVDETRRFANVDHLTQLAQIRDPRDILVSQYFSFGWTHVDTNWNQQQRDYRKAIQQLTIDEYVTDQSLQDAEKLVKSFDRLLEAVAGRSADDPDVPVVLRYEDMVLDFKNWVRPVLEPFDYRFASLAAAYFANDYRDEFKVSGESMSHKRRVTPGDHVEKLRPESIALLNERFEPVLKQFGYLR